MRPFATAGHVVPSSRIRRCATRRVLSPTLTATEIVVGGLMTTTPVRVTARRRVVTNSGGTVKLNAPPGLAVTVGISVYRPGAGNGGRSSATGIEPMPLTAPVTCRPLPHVGRRTAGVMATPVGALWVVNVLSPARATPAAFVATARKW